VSPPDRVVAVIGLQIAMPKLLPLGIVSRQIAVAEMNDHHPAVGHRRGAGNVLQVVEPLLAALRGRFLFRRAAGRLCRLPTVWLRGFGPLVLSSFSKQQLVFVLRW